MSYLTALAARNFDGAFTYVKEHPRGEMLTYQDIDGTIEIAYDCEGPSGSGRCELLSGDARQVDRPLVDMSAEDLEVVWE